MLKRKRVSDLTELKIVTAAIYDDDFFLEFQSLYTPGLLSDIKYDKIINWILSYQEIYDKVPGSHIHDLFVREWERDDISDEEAKLIERVLKKTEKEQDKGYQREFLIEKAREIFQKRALESLTKSIEASDIPSALEQIEQFSVPEKEITFILPLETPEKFREAIEKKSLPLIRLKGALGEMMNPYLTRDSFVSFLAPEKRGKSWILFELTLKAIQCRNNVALFCVGDMSEDQTLRRLGQMLTQRPVHEHELGRECLTPVIDCKKNQDNTCSSIHRTNKRMLLDETDEKPEWFDAPKDYRPCQYCKRKGKVFPEETWFKSEVLESILDGSVVEEKIKKLKSRIHGRQFRLSTHPNSTLTVSDMNRILKKWKREGFVPDVLVIDYADILAQESGGREFRHGENDKWKALRKLSQVWKCCLMTATQADAASYNTEDLSLSNFSEDKRKYSHATAFFGINETTEDKKAKTQRISTLLLREGDFDVHKQVRVLQCRAKGQVHIDSFWVYSHKS